MDEQRLAELANTLEGRWRDHKGDLIVSEAEVNELLAEVRRLRAERDRWRDDYNRLAAHVPVFNPDDLDTVDRGGRGG